MKKLTNQIATAILVLSISLVSCSVEDVNPEGGNNGGGIRNPMAIVKTTGYSKKIW